MNKRYTTAVLFLSLIYFMFLLDVINNRGILGWDACARSVGGITIIKYLTSDLSSGEVVACMSANHYYTYQGTFLYGPLHAISNAISYSIFGFSTFSARLPVAISGAAGIFICYQIGRLMYRDPRIGFFAAIFIIGSPIYFNFSTINFSEVPIILCISLGTLLLFYVKKNYIDGAYKNHSGIKGSENYYVLLGVVAGVSFVLAGLTKPSAALIILPISVYILHAGIAKKEILMKKTRKDRRRVVKYYYNISIRSFLVFILPLAAIGILISLYWAYLDSIGFLHNQYLEFWTGKMGHGIPEPFSIDMFLNFYKPMLIMFPTPIILLSLLGIYYNVRDGLNSEEIFLIFWILIYYLMIIITGAISPQYSLPAIPALAIFAAVMFIRIIDEYKTTSLFDMKSLLSGKEKNLRSLLVLFLLLFAVIQCALTPFYKITSLQDDAETNERYNPYVVRNALHKCLPSLYYLNTGYWSGSTINYFGRNDLVSPGDIDIYRSLSATVVSDIQKKNHPTATVVFINEIPNYFDRWYTIADKDLTYKLMLLPQPDMLFQYCVYDPAPKYLILNKELKERLIESPDDGQSLDGYSIYRMHINNESIQLEPMEIDQVIRF